MKNSIQFLSKSIFNSLIERVKCDTGKDFETIEFSGDYDLFSISFRGEQKKDFKLQVVEFGFLIHKQWFAFELTEVQHTTLQNIINSKVEELETLLTPEEDPNEDFNGSYYDYYGINQNSFINGL